MKFGSQAEIIKQQDPFKIHFFIYATMEEVEQLQIESDFEV